LNIDLSSVLYLKNNEGFIDQFDDGFPVFSLTYLTDARAPPPRMVGASDVRGVAPGAFPLITFLTPLCIDTFSLG
jgi:hypothetical protein